MNNEGETKMNLKNLIKQLTELPVPIQALVSRTMQENIDHGWSSDVLDATLKEMASSPEDLFQKAIETLEKLQDGKSKDMLYLEESMRRIQTEYEKAKGLLSQALESCE